MQTVFKNIGLAIVFLIVCHHSTSAATVCFTKDSSIAIAHSFQYSIQSMFENDNAKEAFYKQQGIRLAKANCVLLNSTNEAAPQTDEACRQRPR